MSSNKSFALAAWAKKGQAIIDKANSLYNELGLSKDDLPTTLSTGEKPVSLVFAGQYSAGKSTILKALTGIKTIDTGEGITTQQAHEYEWNGMTVIDTPGIGTQLRPDHDEISFKAIADADLLVYIVTHNLFDQLIGADFRKLIIDNDKAKETILIVNKMADVGNTVEMRKIKTEDLRKVTAPYSPEDLRTCFVDAESYVDSITEEDSEIAAELLERANYNELVDTINSFVREKNLSARITTALYQLVDSVQRKITDFRPSSGDDDIDGLEEIQLRQKGIYVNARKTIEYEVKTIYRAAAADIREIGQQLANSLESFSSQSEADDAAKNAQGKVTEISEKCQKDIERTIEDTLNEVGSEIDEFYNSSFIKNVYTNLEKKNLDGNPIVKKIVSDELLIKGGQQIVVHSGGGAAPLKGLTGFKGTNIHQMVLDVGHFFGHTFKPWEAVKITKGINVAGKILGVAGTILSIGMQAKEDHDTEKRVTQLREARESVRGSFNSVAEELESHFSKSIMNFISTNISPRIQNIDDSITSIRSLRAGKSEKCNRLEALEADCRKLISEIHSEDFSQ